MIAFMICVIYFQNNICMVAVAKLLDSESLILIGTDSNKHIHVYVGQKFFFLEYFLIMKQRQNGCIKSVAIFLSNAAVFLPNIAFDCSSFLADYLLSIATVFLPTICFRLQQLLPTAERQRSRAI